MPSAGCKKALPNLRSTDDDRPHAHSRTDRAAHRLLYTDHGILLELAARPRRPEALPGVCRWASTSPVASAVDALAGCAADGEDRDCFSYAVSTSADGTKVALLWASGRRRTRRGDPARRRARADGGDAAGDGRPRRLYFGHDWEIGEADPDDFRLPCFSRTVAAAVAPPPQRRPSAALCSPAPGPSRGRRPTRASPA